MNEGLLALGEIMMSASQRRLQVVAQNVSNSSTPGFRAGRVYETASVATSQTTSPSNSPDRRFVHGTNFTEASIQFTGANLDLAITGEGFFTLRDGDQVLLSRGGRFQRDAEGRITDASGRALLGVDGNDIRIAGDVDIIADGVVLQDRVPIARIAVVAPDNDQRLTPIGGALFQTTADNVRAVDEPVVRQGMLESSNVETTEEMLQMMTAVRQAEMGARVIQTYDTLIGQAITTLGRGQ